MIVPPVMILDERLVMNADTPWMIEAMSPVVVVVLVTFTLLAKMFPLAVILVVEALESIVCPETVRAVVDALFRVV